jgi:hypothetical protein
MLDISIIRPADSDLWYIYIYDICPLKVKHSKDFKDIYIHVYQNSMEKLKEWLPHIERRHQAPGNGPEEEEDVLDAVHRSPGVSTRRLGLQRYVPHMTIWRL